MKNEARLADLEMAIRYLEDAQHRLRLAGEHDLASMAERLTERTREACDVG